MTDARRQEISREIFFSKISTYILEVTERVDLEPYIPVLELLRWLFVPSIEHRILTLLEHFVYNDNGVDSSCNESAQSFLGDMESWLEASNQLNRILRPDGLARIFVNSILLGNRITRISRQLDSLSVEDSTRCPKHDAANNGAEGGRQSRKRKATYEEEIPTAANISIEDQTEGTKRSKLRLVVTELPSSERGCCSSSHRRTDYLRLPCDSRALKQKLFKHQEAPKNSGKFDQRLKNVCSCLNNVMERMDDETLNDAALFCELRRNYVRFKLSRIKSKLCMFAMRVAFGCQLQQQQQRRRDNLREDDASSQPRYCWNGNCSVSQKDCGNGSSDDLCDKSTTSDNSEIGCAIRFLWNPSRHCFATSSVEDELSDDEKNCYEGNESRESYNNASHRECESQKNMTSKEYCLCVHENTSDECEIKSPSIEETKRCHFEMMTDDIEEKDYDRTAIELKCAAIMTDEVDEPVELTNIYVNEISICCCCQGCNALENVGVNTESILKHSNGSVEASTNTEKCRLKEMSTQVFFKEIQFCTCYKNVDEELEIKNLKFENQGVDFNCQFENEMAIDEKIKLIGINNRVAEQNIKETPFDEIIWKLAESPCKSSEFTEIMKLKINEIVDLNEKIRKKVNKIKDNKDARSVLVQTLIKQISRDSVTTKIQVKASVISFKSKASGNTCVTKPSANGNLEVCENPVLGLNDTVGDNSPLKKSILTEVTASLEHPILQRLKTDIIYQCVKMSKSSSLSNSYFCSDTSSIEKYFVYSENDYYNKSDAQRTCRCSKKSNFLNFLLDYLTRETYEKFKRILRLILKKLLEKAKELNALRKSGMRSKCRCYCCRDESYEECRSDETRSSEKNSAASRLSGGGSDVTASCDDSRKRKLVKLTRSALTCRDLDCTTETKVQRRYRRRRSRRKPTERCRDDVENGNGLKRCRTEIFTPARANSCAGYRDCPVFTNSWKYCYVR
ncbi:uncharacterized protein LOC131670216 [Phymastichus coffea]|uniref:uncharacterized protein LOC131670216 n=1 Tax=Phymastichus coffea TaxID=108790 RepID=UPI00273B2BF6|nr:uncharacterized protein LOC131670216 [Phymastichus coffea]